MAAAASRRHLIGELSRPRNSSPNDERYATAHSDNSFNPEAEAIHSTIQFENNHTATQQPLPTMPTRFGVSSDNDSEEMSIEVGRGATRRRTGREDVSSSFRFKMGDDQSSYEITGTPPLRPQEVQRSNGNSTRQRNTHSGNGAAPSRAVSQPHYRSLSQEINGPRPADIATQHMAQHPRSTRFGSRSFSTNVPTRSSRFVREVLGGQTPVNHGVEDQIAESMAGSQSFMIPELSNIQELLSGVSAKATPGLDRSVKSRSRFAPNLRPTKNTHVGIETTAVPKEESAIYQSLQILQTRLAQLEVEKSEAQRRADEQEEEIIGLRGALDIERRARGLDSALGSDEEHGIEQEQRVEKAKLQSSIKSLQDRLAKSDRKISNSEMAVKRITKERDDILARFTITTEELRAENEVFREERGRLIDENDELREEVERLAAENQDLRVQLAEKTAQLTIETQTAATRRSSHPFSRENAEAKTETLSQMDLAAPESNDMPGELNTLMKSKRAQHGLKLLQEFGGDIQAAIAEWNTLKLKKPTGLVRQPGEFSERQSSHSASRSRSAARRDRMEFDTVDDVDTTTEMSLTHKTRNTLQRMSIPSAFTTDKDRKDDAPDMTRLSDIDTDAIEAVRKILEAEHATTHRQRRRTLAKAVHRKKDKEAMHESTETLKRRSSLKNIIAASVEKDILKADATDDKLNNTVKAAKTVRVQSPHVSDDLSRPLQQNSDIEYVSTRSNTGRRRQQRSRSVGGEETAAFTLPISELQHNESLPMFSNQEIQHNPKDCTACPHEDTEVNIPAPLLVTERQHGASADATDATIRPAKSAPLALAIVIKQMDDEVKHLKLQEAEVNRQYILHNPAFARSRRVDLNDRLDGLKKEIEKRSDQLYNLHDVLLGSGNHFSDEDRKAAGVDDTLNETLERIGLERSGHIARAMPTGFNSAGDISDDELADLPWEGLSDIGNDEVAGQ